MKRNCKWTDQEMETLRSMWQHGRHTKEICQALGRTKKAMEGKAHLMRLGARQGLGLKRTPEAIARIRKLREEGCTWSKIAKECGADITSVRKWHDHDPCQFSAGSERSTLQADRDAARLAKLIPPDTRDLTAQLCGDPLPGRRALDHRTSTEHIRRG